MGERKDRLQVLAEERDVAYLKIKEQKERVTHKLYDLLNQLNHGPLKIRVPEDKSVGLCQEDKNMYQSGWRITEEIRFLEEGSDKKWDFGSSFSLYIFENRIEVNPSSCGSWGKSDKGQWSRLLLIKEIFYHEEDILREISQLVDMSCYEEFDKADREIDKINREIQEEKQEAERQRILSLLKPGKYLAEKHHDHYFNFEMIEGVTAKTVLTIDPNYRWITHRKKLDEIIKQIRYNLLFVINSMEEVPDHE